MGVWRRLKPSALSISKWQEAAYVVLLPFYYRGPREALVNGRLEEIEAFNPVHLEVVRGRLWSFTTILLPQTFGSPRGWAFGGD